MHWDEARVGALQDLAARHDATLFIALQALVKLLLYRYSGQTDLIIGTPIAGRDSPALEGQVGLFINLLALRDQIDPEGGFDPIARAGESNSLRRIHPSRLSLRQSDRGFDEVLRHRPDTTVQCIGPTAKRRGSGCCPGPTCRSANSHLARRSQKYDLIFEFAQHGESLVLLLTYSTGLFEAATIERLCGHLGRMLEAVLAEPDRAIRELPLLSRAERQQLAV